MESVRLLIQAGADVHAIDKEGRGAVYWVSATRRRKQFIKAIVEDRELTEEEKRQVLEKFDKEAPRPGKDERDVEIEALLRAAGAKD